MKGSHRFGQVFKLADGGMALSSVGLISDIDTHKMSATAVISTPTPDRVGDSLDPLGCVLDEYRLNPIVLWNHGFDLTLPIGRSEDHGGNCTVKANSRNVRATCFFTNKFLEAEQIFELVAERTVRATSVRFDPIVNPIKAKGIQRFPKWMLLEWCWLALGCNAEAISEVIAKNHLAGRQIAEPIFKTLSLMVPGRKTLVRGHSTKGNDMTQTVEKAFDKKPPVDDEEKKPESCKCEEGESCEKCETPEEMPESDDEPTTGEQADGSIIKNDELNEPATDQIESSDGDMNQKPYGAQLVEAVFAALTDLQENVARGVATLENPAIKTMLTEFHQGLQESLSAMDGAYQGSYGKSLSQEEIPSEDEPVEDEMRLKAFLSRSPKNRFYVGGAVDRLKSVLSAGGLSIGQRASIAKSVETFDNAVKGARNFEMPKEPDHSKALAGAIGEFGKAASLLKSLVPKR